MRRHLLISLGLAIIAAVAAAVPAAAGGWAVTTLDAVPTEFESGQVYPVGYTIRQHGQTPYATSESAIEIRSTESGQTLLFTGTPDGAPGHYVAQVSFPSAGSWEWTVYQGPFEPQELGVVSVLAPAAAAAAATPSSGDGLFEARAWRVVFPAAALLMALLFALQLVALTRERRGAERAGAASEPATAGD